jgi:hypothetical protein
MNAATVTPLRRVCARCRSVIGDDGAAVTPAGPAQANDTHGECNQCLQSFLEQHGDVSPTEIRDILARNATP